MTSEPEGREGATGTPDATDSAAAEAAVAEAAAAKDARAETVAGAETPETVAGAVTPQAVAGAETPATVHTAAPAAEDARDMTTPSPQEDADRIRSYLETIKTAVVWLVVIQILTILSPLLPVSLKWMLVVGLILTLGSFAVAAVAYLRAQRAQRNFPE